MFENQKWLKVKWIIFGTCSACGYMEGPKMALPVLVQKSETTFIIQTFPKKEDQDHWFHFQSVFIIITLFIIFTSEQKCRPNSLPSFTFTLVTWQQSVFINPQINIITKKKYKKINPEQGTENSTKMIRSPTCSSCLSESRKIFSKKVFVSSGIKSPFVLEIVLQAVFPREEFAEEEMDAFFWQTLRTDLLKKHPLF